MRKKSFTETAVTAKRVGRGAFKRGRSLFQPTALSFKTYYLSSSRSLVTVRDTMFRRNARVAGVHKVRRLSGIRAAKLSLKVV